MNQGKRRWQWALVGLAFALLVIFPLASQGTEAGRGFAEAWPPYVVFILLNAGAASLALRGPRAVGAILAAVLLVLGVMYFFFTPLVAIPPALILAAALLGPKGAEKRRRAHA